MNSLRRLDTSGVTDSTVVLRLRLIEQRVAMLREVLEQDKAATAELAKLVDEANMATPVERPCASSSATSPTRSTEPCSGTLDGPGT